MADEAEDEPAEDDVVEDADEDGGEDGEEGEGSGGRKLSGKKLILLAGVPVLLLLLAGGAFMGGFIGGPGGDEEHAEEEGPPPEIHFFDLPEMLVNLNTGSNRTTFLKVKVSLEIEGAEAVPVLENLLPRVLDNFQVYLRELRIEDLNGSAGLFRLKQELLMRINRAVDPIRVTDVLFREILVQ
ncbi:MAG: flagellar basal body-associated FliL family protein [Proteobacteria bacterium]|nr:flagellar basal body-associated FliL family protein [Pseudomonadota bacterium]